MLDSASVSYTDMNVISFDVGSDMAVIMARNMFM